MQVTLTEQILKAAEFNENYISPLRGLCTREDEIRIWNDGGYVHAIRLKPLILALASAVEALDKVKINCNHLNTSDSVACMLTIDHISELSDDALTTLRQVLDEIR